MVGKKLYLHIGFGKAGSTTIQSILKKNVEMLHSNGFEYLDLSRDCIDWIISNFMDWPESERLKNWTLNIKRRNLDRKYNKEALRKEVIELIQDTGKDNIFISHEGFCGFWDFEKMPPENRRSSRLKYLFDDFENIHFTWIVRNQASYIASFYFHDIVHGDVLSFNDYFNKCLPFCDWNKKIAEFEDLFPGATFSVSSFERAIKEGLVKTFCRSLGLSHVEIEDEIENPGINPYLLPVFKIWCREFSYEDIHRLRLFFQGVTSYEVGKPKFFPFTHRQLEMIKDRFHESNRELFQRFNIDDEQGFLEWARPYLEPPRGNVHNGENDLSSALPVMGRYILLVDEKNKKDNAMVNSNVRKEQYLRGYLRSFINFNYPLNRGAVPPIKKRVALYGAGSHTRIFLEELEKAGIRELPVVLDGNTFDHDGVDMIIISSRSFEKEIYEKLVKIGVPPAKIVRLYED